MTVGPNTDISRLSKNLKFLMLYSGLSYAWLNIIQVVHKGSSQFQSVITQSTFKTHLKNQPKIHV
jgi:hypothetical protein